MNGMDPRSPVANGRRRSTVFDADGEVFRASPQYRSFADRCATDPTNRTSDQDQTSALPTAATGKGIIKTETDTGGLEPKTPELNESDNVVVLKSNSNGFKYRSVAAEWAAEHAPAKNEVLGVDKNAGVAEGHTSGNGESPTTVNKKTNTAREAVSTPRRAPKVSAKTSPFSLGLAPSNEQEESDRRRVRAVRFGLFKGAARQAVPKENEDAQRRNGRARRFGLTSGSKNDNPKSDHNVTNGGSQSTAHKAKKGGKRRFFPY